MVPINHCPILDPALEAERIALRITTPAQGLTNGDATSMALDGGSAPEIEFTVSGERIRASADVFFQATSALLGDFVARMTLEAVTGRPDSVLELYAGIGLFTLPLARLVGRIETVESSTKAVAIARNNVRLAGLANVRVHQATVERWLRQRRFEPVPDVVVVDPPRAGLSDQVTARLVALAPRRLVYVSCDPATFARDSRKLVRASYRIVSWTAFDLFPQTHHVELVARFEHTAH